VSQQSAKVDVLSATVVSRFGFQLAHVPTNGASAIEAYRSLFVGLVLFLKTRPGGVGSTCIALRGSSRLLDREKLLNPDRANEDDFFTHS